MFIFHTHQTHIISICCLCFPLDRKLKAKYLFYSLFIFCSIRRIVVSAIKYHNTSPSIWPKVNIKLFCMLRCLLLASTYRNSHPTTQPPHHCTTHMTKRFLIKKRMKFIDKFSKTHTARDKLLDCQTNNEKCLYF